MTGEVNFWGLLVASLRAEHGVSQRELCSTLAIARNTLRGIETGASNVDVVTLEKIVNHFGYEIDVFERDPPFRSITGKSSISHGSKAQ